MEGHSDMIESEKSLDNVVLGGPEEDENKSKSAGENTDGGESGDELNSSHGESSNRRKYNRHNDNQVQELEAFFKENPHPGEKERLELGAKLSMNSKQVKFWFQNKRTQQKWKLERQENETLKQENDKLREEQITLKEVMRNPICNSCGNQAIIGDINVDEYQTKIENDRLKDESKRISVLAEKFLGPSTSIEGSMASMMENSNMGFKLRRNGFGGMNVMDTTTSPNGVDLGNNFSVISPQLTTLLVNKDVTYDKSTLKDLAYAAMNELLRLAEVGEPLWFKNMSEGGETLNLEEYARSFTRFTSMSPGYFTTEATRASGTVINNSQTLVETLMDKSRWMEMFSCIVGKTSTIEVISSGTSGSRSGTLQLIETEFQIISELVLVREIKFLRFCQQLAECIWVVVDMSVDTIQEGSSQCKFENCKRLPSGCIVQDLLNGCSKVTWIEHMEYNENFLHQLYRPLVKTGLGFGAQKWMAILQRQSEIVAMINATICLSGQKSIWMMAQRMTRKFCTGVCATIHKWETVQIANGEDVKLMIRKNIDDPNEPIGVVLSATKTIWLPVKQKSLFEFFTNEQTRSQWDVLSCSGPMQQMVHVFKVQNLDSSISLFRVNGDDTGARMLTLQETFTNATGSLLVYAIIDSLAMNVMMNGGDSSCVALLPSGIAIVPDCFQDFSGKKDNDTSCSGSLLTIGLQVLVNSSPAAKFSMESAKTVKDLISRTIHDIKTALNCN